MGFCIDFGLVYLSKEKLGIQKYVANAIGFISAVSFNYVLNRLWTFQSDSPEITLQYVKFFSIGAIGLGLHHYLLKALHERLRVPFYLAKLIGVVIVFIFNFFGNYYLTFR